jgi:hypothetical protein
MTQAAAAAISATETESVGCWRSGDVQIVSPWLNYLSFDQFADLVVRGREVPAPRVFEREWLDKPGLDPLIFRGIAVAMLLAIPLWGGLGLIVDWILLTA